MLLLVPLVHARKRLVRLVNGEHRPVAQNYQLFVGHDRGDLDDDVRIRLEAGHLQIDPDEVVRARHGRPFPGDMAV